MNDKRQPNQTSIDRIAEELSSWAGQGALIIDHMARWPGSESSEMNAVERLGTLIRDTVALIAERHAVGDLAVAADVLADAIETLGSEILLVDPSVLEDGP